MNVPRSSLGVERHANTVVPDNLELIAAFAPKHEEVSGMGIAAEGLLDAQREAVHAATNVGMARSQPNADMMINRDHRCTSAEPTLSRARAAWTTEYEPDVRGFRSRWRGLASPALMGIAPEASRPAQSS